MINCGKALAANTTVIAIEKVVDHSISKIVGEDPKRATVKSSFCVGIVHGLPLQVALLSYKGAKSVWKWASTLLKYCYVMYQTNNPEEYEFYSENWMKVFNRSSVELVKSIGTQVFVALVSLLLEGIGMTISYFFFPDVEIRFSGRDLLCAFSLLEYRCLVRKQRYTHILQPQMIDQTQPIMKGAVNSCTHPHKKMQISQPPALIRPPIIVPMPMLDHTIISYLAEYS